MTHALNRSVFLRRGVGFGSGLSSNGMNVGTKRARDGRLSKSRQHFASGFRNTL